jgi:hypothetical protein
MEVYLPSPMCWKLSTNASEWPLCSANFLERGGTAESVFLAICQGALEQDECMGDGNHEDMFWEHIKTLPECRNDDEFGYASGMCGYRRISLTRNVDPWGKTLDEGGRTIDSLL